MQHKGTHVLGPFHFRPNRAEQFRRLRVRKRGGRIKKVQEGSGKPESSDLKAPAPYPRILTYLPHPAVLG